MAEAAVIELNVGGRVFHTRRDTLKRIPMIDRLLEFPSSSETIFLDRDPQIFEIILNIARGWPTRILQHLTPYQRQAVLLDADYYLMDVLETSRWFVFKWAQSNEFAMITNEGTSYTIGKIPKYNTILANRALPLCGRVYWEVVILKKPTQSWDCIGIAEPSVDFKKHLTQSGGWCWDASLSKGGLGLNGSNNNHGLMPFATGMVVGVDVDMDRGTLSFWANGEFLVLATSGLSGKSLFPALSVADETVMQVRSGLAPPDLA